MLSGRMGGGGEGLRIEGLVPVSRVGHVQADHIVKLTLVKLNMAKSAC